MAYIEFNYSGSPDIGVKITADFLAWETEEMIYDNGKYHISFALAPGKYLYKFIISGVYKLDPCNLLTESGPHGICNVCNVERSSRKGRYSIAVVANMSAGKTTLINALLGGEFLLSRNAACTQTIYKVHFCNTSFNKGRIYPAPYKRLTRENLEQWNVSGCDLIDIKAKPYQQELSNSSTGLVIYDTPGNNDTVNKKTANLAQFGLSRKRINMLICVLDYRRHGTTTEMKMLRAVKKLYNSRNKKIKLIFFLNQIDEYSPRKDRKLGQQINIIKKRLYKTGFNDFELLYGAANEGLLLRSFFLGKIEDPFEIIEFNKMTRRFSLLHDYLKRLFLRDKLMPCFRDDNKITFVSQKNTSRCESKDLKFLLNLEALTGIPTLENIILKEMKNVN